MCVCVCMCVTEDKQQLLVVSPVLLPPMVQDALAVIADSDDVAAAGTMLIVDDAVSITSCPLSCFDCGSVLQCCLQICVCCVCVCMCECMYVCESRETKQIMHFVSERLEHKMQRPFVSSALLPLSLQRSLCRSLILLPPPSPLCCSCCSLSLSLSGLCE